MPEIHLVTYINAPLKIVFDLSRSIDLHKKSLDHTGEEAVAGRTSGLVEQGDTVTWRATHFGFRQELTSRITEVRPYSFFADEMQQGIFKKFKHEHHFERLEEGRTLMKDIFIYTSPLGLLGNLADLLFLKKYMRELLSTRNQTLKEYAEKGDWKSLPGMKAHL
ncbi:SRPBCC family protein [Nonlabens xiamenensis]|uniref:SRPBCC family protein n=1 Tax=Nonlabens xiamenensis TaxID=2341043 RepID=UPI000F613CBB|nr:SRPBCC family protein [Nonlabens xiamenensis]